MANNPINIPLGDNYYKYAGFLCITTLHTIDYHAHSVTLINSLTQSEAFNQFAVHDGNHARCNQ